MKWISVNEQTPPDMVILETKIHDQDGERNNQRLVKKGNLWWTDDMKMYVYYRPTHWAFITV